MIDLDAVMRALQAIYRTLGDDAEVIILVVPPPPRKRTLLPRKYRGPGVLGGTAESTPGSNTQ